MLGEKIKEIKRKVREFVRKLEKEDKKKLAIEGAAALGIVVILGFVTAVSVGVLAPGSPDGSISDALKGHKKGSSEDHIAKAPYAYETDYEGSNLPYDCYAIPFSSAREYIPNKELLDQLRDDVPKMYEDKAIEYFDTLFNHGYRDVITNQDNYEKSIIDLYGLNGDRLTDTSKLPEDYSDEDLEKASMTSEEFANKLAVWFGDNKVNCESKFITHKSMLYRENVYFKVRGAWTIRADTTEKGCEELKKMFGVDLKPGEEKTYVADVVFFMTWPEKVMGFDVLKEVTEW